MILHEDKETFVSLIQEIAQIAKLPELYVEKDYWVTFALRNIATSEFTNDVVFKGGTSLSKAHKLIRRFSEDIDLALIAGGLSGNQKKSRLKDIELAATKGQHFEEMKGDSRESKGGTFRKVVYQYPQTIRKDDYGQASPELLIEVNSFVTPNPHKQMTLESIVSETLREIGRDDLIGKYELDSFDLKVLSPKRTLIEKVLFLTKYSHPSEDVKKLFEKIRHLYDIHQILENQELSAFAQSPDFKKLLLEGRAEEMKAFKGKAWYDDPIEDARIFTSFDDFATRLNSEYKGSFADMVVGEPPDFSKLRDAVMLLRDCVK